MAVAGHWLLRPRTLLLFSITFFIVSPLTLSITETEALLKLKESFTNANSLGSWKPDSAPCNGNLQWEGLICSNGVVSGLRLAFMGLSGEINMDALVELPGLRTISLNNNSFSGALPELNRLGYLKAIYLSGNQFSGVIPSDFFKSMDSLKKLWLSDNKLSGEIPVSLTQLPSLMELNLENNQFSGSIPSFEQKSLMSINLANNKLEGEVPESLSKFGAGSFSGNSGLCGKSLGIECNQKEEVGNNVEAEEGANDDSTKIVAALITISVLVLSILIVLLVKFRRKKQSANDHVSGRDNIESVEVKVSMSNRKEPQLSKKASSRKGPGGGKNGAVGELVVVNDAKGVFGLPDLMKATAEVLGSGGLGSAYKALMMNGVTVVVKRMREMNAMGRDGYDAEIRKLVRLKHSNIISPLAYHYRKDEKLLVYEYVPKGSLLYLLHGDRGRSHDEFDWPARLKIIKGIARGIGYLHTELASMDLPHGNLKSSNVLLGPDNEPLISEFGFSPLINNSHLPQALFAYKAPEAVQSGKVSKKCDVYCLGILILEILTGKFPSQYLNQGKGGTDLVQWLATTMSEGRLTEFLAPEIANSTHALGEMEQLLRIGAACIESNPEQRLDMRDAVSRIVELQATSSDQTSIDVTSFNHSRLPSESGSDVFHDPSGGR